MARRPGFVRPVLVLVAAGLFAFASLGASPPPLIAERAEGAEQPALTAAQQQPVAQLPAARAGVGVVTLVSALNSALLERPAVSATLEPASIRAGRLPLNGAIVVRFSRPVRIASVARALAIRPATSGTVVAASGSRSGLASRIVWRPTRALQPGTTYRFQIRGTVSDETGFAAAATGTLSLRTIVRVAPPRPTVIRHRPASGATNVKADALISIRFSERMNRATTEKAFAISGLKASDGTFSWVDKGTVIVFDPRAPLKTGARYVVTLAATARSARGPTLKAKGTALSYSFKVAPAAARAAPKPSGSGGSAATGWRAVERYVLGLVNCIRTGGYLRSNGSCSGYGSGKNGGYAPPLKIHAGISDKVARPYAKFLATRNLCNHFLDGNPGFRLRRSGYTSYRWAENLGCRSGNPYTAVTGSHLYFQSERPYNGGHWVNLKNPRYTTVGIGVWVSHGNVRVVTDFYDP